MDMVTKEILTQYADLQQECRESCSICSVKK